MVVPPAKPGRLRRFFQRIRTFLTPRQFTKVRQSYRQETGSKPPPIIRDQPVSAPREPAAQRRAEGSPPVRGADEIRAEQRRIEELRRIEREAKAERESLETKTTAQQPPIGKLEDFRERKGFAYSTWFKAFGTFGDLRDMGDSPTLLGEMEELEDMDVPAAFYSSSILGKVKWKGRIEREKLIDDLNKVSAWNPEDFRSVYPKWEYRYYVAEMVGDVTVNIWEHKARQPLNRKAKQNGYKGF